MLAATLLFGTGCKKEDTPKPVAEESTETPAKPETGIDQAAQVVAKLVKADGVDGATDKVVSKCGGCKLGMDGTAEHTLTVSGYTLQFCSEDCKKSFEKDPTSAILAMAIPEG